MLDFACGELELREATFRDMTHVEFNRRARGYNRKREERLHLWRELVCGLWNPHLKSSDRVKPEDVVRLSFDKADGFSDELKDKLREWNKKLKR